MRGRCLVGIPSLRLLAGARTQLMLPCASRGRGRGRCRQRKANMEHGLTTTLNSRDLPQGQQVPAVHDRIPL
jgi:hypothetical protein